MIGAKQAAGQVARPATLAGRIEFSKILSWLGLAVPVLVSASLNLWNLAQNGYSNLYYAVAVQSMTQSWRNFFFASYDAGGFISVDKPPVALWVQAISAKIFGFSPLSLLLPEALAGVAAVALLYYLVKRVFGPMSGFVAAMALALTPIAVAMERTNGVDTILAFTILLAAWAISLAAEKGRFGLLALGLALVGVAFNIKMLEAFIVLPAFYLFYVVAARAGWWTRLLHLALGSVVVFGVALSWPLAVQFTPPDQRPWVGGSQGNSIFDLTLNYNGLGRVTGDEGIGGQPGGQPARGIAPNFGGSPPGGQSLPPPDGNRIQPWNSGRGAFRPRGGQPGGGMFGAGEAGPLRLFTAGELPGQWSWLFPVTAFGVLASGLALRRRFFTTRQGQAILLWGGWLVMYGVVFSIAEGIFHPYYLIMLAPPVAALVGSGVAALWRAYRSGGLQKWLLPAALLVTAVWQRIVLNQYPQWAAALGTLLLCGTLVAAVGLVAGRLVDRQVDTWAETRVSRLARRMTPGFLGVGMVALLIAPFSWSITPVIAAPNNASLPIAGPSALTDNSATWTTTANTQSSLLVSYLQANRDGYFYLLAVATSQEASSIALETGQPVLAMGGFMGSDPAMTVEKLQEMIANKQVRFVMASGFAAGRGAGMSSQTVSSWVQANCSAVDTSLWQSTQGSSSGPGFMGGFPGEARSGQLYNCAP